MQERIASLDLARGLAVALMFLVHTVKGLLAFEHLPAWGLSPVLLLGQAAPALFALVFGLTAAWILAPRVERPDWPREQRRLLVRGLGVLALVELLTWVQLFQFYPWGRIADALLWRSTPDFVGVLRFYALALVLLPLLLPRWQKLPRALRLAAPCLVFAMGRWLAGFRAPGLEPLQALLWEHPSEPAFGLLTHGALALLGLSLGDLTAREPAGPSAGRASRLALRLGLGLLGGLVLAWALSLFAAPHSLGRLLQEVAMTRGKHPPGFYYTLATLGQALLLLGLALASGPRIQRLLAPLRWLGREALFAFALHVAVIFVGFRYLLGLRYQSARPGFAIAWAFGVRPPGFRVPFEAALGLWLGLTALAAPLCALRTRLRLRRPRATP